MSAPLDTGAGLSPDQAAFVDLDLLDLDEQAILDQAIERAQEALPGWQPREGNTEVVLMESLAVISAEQVYALNRVPELVLELLLGIYGLTRDPGAACTGTVTFTLSDTAGHTVPAGTLVRYTRPDSGEVVDLTTTQDLDVLAGSNTGTVAVAGTVESSAGTGIPAGTRLQVISAVAYVDKAEVATTLTGGRDSESDTAFWARGVQVLARLTSTLVTPASFEAAALATAGVARATVVDRYDPGSTNQPGQDLGHVTVAIADATGAPLAQVDKDALADALTTQAQAGLTVHVIDPTITSVDVSATVTADLTVSDPDELAQACTDALTEWLSPSGWDWSPTVARTDIIAHLARVQGVARIISITTPAADVALTGVAPLVTAGTVSIVVQPGT